MLTQNIASTVENDEDNGFGESVISVAIAVVEVPATRPKAVGYQLRRTPKYLRYGQRDAQLYVSRRLMVALTAVLNDKCVFFAQQRQILVVPIDATVHQNIQLPI